MNPIVTTLYMALLKYSADPHGSKLYAFVREQSQLSADALLHDIPFSQFLEAAENYWE